MISMKNYSLVVFISGLVSLLQLIRKLLVWKTFEMKIRKSIENKNLEVLVKSLRHTLIGQLLPPPSGSNQTRFAFCFFFMISRLEIFFDKRPNTGIF